MRIRSPRSSSAAAIVGALLLGWCPGAARAALSTGAGERPWPAGTEFVPFELRDAQILVKARLTSPSGRDTTGLLVLDTGAPVLAVTKSVWRALNVDSLEMGWGYTRLVRRPLATLEMGSARVTGIDVGGVVVDSILGSGVLGFFPPSFYQDRAIAIDYATQRLAIVNRRLAFIRADSTAGARGGAIGAQTRVSRSRSRYAEALGPAAVALPFRRFEGGRILVTARIAEPSQGWQSPLLTLMLDTGASACVLFEDVDAAVLRSASRWPRQSDVPFRTVLGSHRHDVVLLPILRLAESSPPLEQRMVAAGIVARKSLPDLQGEIPERIDGLLGNSFLQRYRLILDYGNDVAWLEPRSAGPFVAPVKVQGTQVGIQLERVWGELRVAAVESGSPADLAGIRQGDLLVGIDQVRVGAFEEEAAERLLFGAPGSEVVLAVRRGGLEQVLHLKRRGR